MAFYTKFEETGTWLGLGSGLGLAFWTKFEETGTHVGLRLGLQ